jgi:hypothetical protein
MQYRKVLIVTVPKQDVVRPPGILAILAACCEQVGSEYQVFDLNLHMHKILPREQVDSLNTDFSLNKFSSDENKQLYEQSCQALLAKIDEFDADLVAISVFTFMSLLATDHLLKLMKSRKFDIVIGGLGITDSLSTITKDQKFGQYCLDSGLVDFVISGEGENTFVELLKGNIHSPGINNVPAIRIADLDSLPTPSYAKININDYFYSNEPEVLITGSKGCVRDCSFCNVAAYWDKYTYRNGSKLADDMYEIFRSTGVNKFEFSDSLINGSISNFRSMNRRLIELRNQDSTFKPQYKGQFICRPIGQLKSTDYEEMKLAGAETLIVGIEHFSENIRDHMRKHFDDAAIDWHFAECARISIKNVVLLLSGYATETIEDHERNVQGLIKYRKYAMTRIISSVSVDVEGLAIFDKTPLFNNAEELGLLVHPEFPTEWVNLNNKSLTKHERLRRATEMLLTAANNGYLILHFNQKIEFIKYLIKEYGPVNGAKFFPIHAISA